MRRHFSAGSGDVESNSLLRLVPCRQGLEDGAGCRFPLGLLDGKRGYQGDRSPFERLAAVLPSRHLHGSDVEQFGQAYRFEPGGFPQPAESLWTHLATAGQIQRDCTLEGRQPRAGDEQFAARLALARGHTASEATAVQIAPSGVRRRLEGGLAARGTPGLLHSSPRKSVTTSTSGASSTIRSSGSPTISRPVKRQRSPACRDDEGP